MTTKEVSTKIVIFMTPWVGGFLLLRCGQISYIVKIHYFFKNLLLYSQAQIRQTVGIYIYDVQGRLHQTFKFHNPQGRDSCDIGRGHLLDIVKRIISLRIFSLHSGIDQTN